MFAVALAVRLLNLSLAFDHGVPQIPPVDDLYHWKRIAASAAQFPAVLELDRDRGVELDQPQGALGPPSVGQGPRRYDMTPMFPSTDPDARPRRVMAGAFCPWPPAYDLVAGGICRMAGARSPEEVLRVAVWFPPIVFALFVAFTAFILQRAVGLRVAAIVAMALATSPFLVTASSVGNIDHHFLEPPLTFAILGATCLGLRARGGRSSTSAGVLLGLAIVAALFVQTALLIAAGLTFLCLFLFTDGLTIATGFSIASLAVVLYRLTRMPGYPDTQWFLGWIHAALFAGAAVAGALLWRGRQSSRRSPIASRCLALLGGAIIILLTPSAGSQLLHGLQFLGGDRWLHTILEFQPLWKARGEDLVSQLTGLSAGALLVWFLGARAWQTRDSLRGTVALFAIAYLLLTLSSRRFWIIGIPLLALAGALHAAQIRRPRLAWTGLLSIAVIPPLQLIGWMTNPLPPVQPLHRPWVRAARFLDTREWGRVLCPWSMGHAVDVIGHHPVVIDNFGTMPDAFVFERAHQALLATSEAALVQYLEHARTRYLVLEEPTAGIRSANAILGTQVDPRTTFWWRVWRGERPQRLSCIWREPTLRIYELSLPELGTPGFVGGVRQRFSGSAPSPPAPAAGRGT